MKNSTFIGLLDSQLELIKKSEGKEANSAILETAKMLLSYIDLSNKKEYDKFDTRELFASVATIGERAIAFFDENKDMLDPAALVGKLGIRLSENQKKITEITNNLNQLKEQEKELLSSEKKLISVRGEFQSLSEKENELRNIYKTMTPAILASMREEIVNLKGKIGQAKIQIDTVTSELEKTRIEFASIDNELTDKETNYNEYCKAVVSFINNHYFTLKQIFEKDNSDIDTIKEKIKNYQCLYSRFNETSKESAGLLALYEAQLGENGIVVESMTKYGVKSLQDALDSIDNIKKEIKENLKAYDLILKKVVEHEESVRQILERRQGKIL